jgi:hypothetical protein
MNSVPAEADIAVHFSPTFLAQVPLAKLVEMGGQIAQAAPYSLEKVTTPPVASDRALVAIVRSSRGRAFNIRLVLEPHGDRIEGLLMRPHVDAKVGASWDEVTATLGAVAPSVNFLAAEIDGKKMPTPIKHRSEKTSRIGLDVQALRPRRPSHADRVRQARLG